VSWLKGILLFEKPKAAIEDFFAWYIAFAFLLKNHAKFHKEIKNLETLHWFVTLFNGFQR